MGKHHFQWVNPLFLWSFSYGFWWIPNKYSGASQELQAIWRALDSAVSAATVAEAQEAQAANEAREANGRVEVAKILGGNRGTRGFSPLEIDEKTYGSHGISMEKRMEIRWNFDRKSMEP